MFSVEGSPSLALYNIAAKAEGVSGRTLRKIPFKVFAEHLQGRNACTSLTITGPCTVQEFLEAFNNSLENVREIEQMK